MINKIKFKYIYFVLILLSVIIIRVDNTMAFLISKTEVITNVFEPYNYPTGSFNIKEEINHSLGENYIIPSTVKFTYKIELGEYYKNQKITTSNGEITADENGAFTVQVNPEIGIVISNIEEGTKVKVTNITSLTGFTLTGDTVKEITVTKDDTTNLSFTSSYAANKVKLDNVSLSSVVDIIGREWKESDQFSLKLEYFNNGVWGTLNSKTIIYSTDTEFNKVNFNDIVKELEFSNIGTYKLRLLQEVGTIEDISYDNKINNIVLVITDQTMDGQLEINDITSNDNVVITKQENNYNLNVQFKNSYVTTEQDLEYVDHVDNSHLNEEIILVKNRDYGIDTLIGNFEGLDNNYTYKVFDREGVEQNSNLVRTGDYLVINHNNTEYRFDVVLFGDLSGDGDVDSLDLASMMNHISEKRLLGEVYEEAAYLNNDDEIDSLDLAYLMNSIAGKEGY